MPVYIPLNIIIKGKGTASISLGINRAAFIVVITQQPNNINNLALITLVGPIVLTLS
jgi:hypothetical protein